ncbi:MAG: YdeI/OmpD-associated family protein [Thermoleophilia bacterium]|nr:YdeI/OmpD-associated family protein [Thermoleophilia bacterium]
MAGIDDQVHPASVEAWGEWLARHHDRGRGVWLVSFKKATGRQAFGYEEAVTEALRVGWVDSRSRALDDERTMLWFAPRAAGSGWSRPNKERIARLEREGRMAEAGLRVVERARADGSWSMLDAVEDGVVPDDLAAAFARHPGSRERWDAFPRSARRGILEWIVQARRAGTRAARVEETARLAARGERANQWRPKGGAGG